MLLEVRQCIQSVAGCWWFRCFRRILTAQCRGAGFTHGLGLAARSELQQHENQRPVNNRYLADERIN
jgi:hypothetical protein